MLKIDFKDFYDFEKNEFERNILEIHDKVEKIKNQNDQFLGWMEYTTQHEMEVKKAIQLGIKFQIRDRRPW